jgi:hypothetical protein
VERALHFTICGRRHGGIRSAISTPYPMKNEFAHLSQGLYSQISLHEPTPRHSITAGNRYKIKDVTPAIGPPRLCSNDPVDLGKEIRRIRVGPGPRFRSGGSALSEVDKSVY